MQLADLNRRFAIADHVQFVEDEGGMVMAEIKNAHASARVALQGAHVVSWQPAGQEPVIWVSKLAKFAVGKSIRGGIPVCWPWFGAHASDSSMPAHGFARTVMWDVLETKETVEGGTYLRFGLLETEATRRQWPYSSSVQLEVAIGKSLKVDLVTRNLGSRPFELGEALHTYFKISDVAQMTIRGLQGTSYMDKADGANDLCKQLNGIRIESEVDRVYMNTAADVLIKDRGLNRAIRIAKQGSRSTIVWNPWTAKAEKMGDFGPDGFRDMVCVESGNALEDTVTLKAGATHRLSVLYTLEPLDD